MYYRVAGSDSGGVFFGLAVDPGRQSLAKGSAALCSTPPIRSTRSVMRPGFGISGLLLFSEFGCARSSNCRSPLRLFAMGADSPHDILGQDAPVASQSASASMASPPAEFTAASSDQETR